MLLKFFCQRVIEECFLCLSQGIEKADSTFKSLIPESTALRRKIQESLENQELVTAKEVMATCIFQGIIWQRNPEINQNIQSPHQPQESEELQNEQTNEILIELGIRQKSESTEEISAINIEDLKNLI